MGNQANGFENDPDFKNFEGNLILGLQNIDMREHVYPELVDNMGQLLARYGDSVASVSIWSQGDEQATDYQVAKIAKSGIMRVFLKAVIGKDQASVEDFIEGEAGFMVSDDKFKNLNEFLQRHPQKTKVVIIEDSRKNLQKAADLVANLNSSRSKGSQIEYIPIWAAYSREGIQAREKGEEFDAALNPLNSPKDLLQEKFAPIFSGAHILVDFDGVIGNNVSMREAQSRAKYNALISSISALRGISAEDAEKVVNDNLQKRKEKL